MSSYNGCFAEFYDRLTDNVDYSARASYIRKLLHIAGVEHGDLVDLGCGTCSLSLPLAKDSFRLTGVDLSEDMLSVAYNKLFDAGCDFSLINDKIEEFEPLSRVDACISTLDTINHIADDADVAKLFSNVFSYLKDDVVFVFDVNTVYKHKKILGDNSFIFDEDDFFLAWDNEQYDDNLVRIMLDFFVHTGDVYVRHSEEFFEKAYDIDYLKSMLEETGFSVRDIYDDLSFEPPKENSERVFFVCKKE